MNDRESEILLQLKAGEEKGFRALFELYYTPLCVFALNYVDSFEKVEDIVQEVFINFWENQKANQLKSSLRSYLFTAVRNNLLYDLRSSSRYRHEAIDARFELADDVLDDQSELEEKKQQIYQQLEQLSPQARAVFERLVFRNMKYKEVASELGVSVNTVKTTFARTLKRLRSSFDLILVILLSSL
ncbi:RNA polymerase sigma-70 factor [Mangrovibacterium marinum]|uniref:RNA polymerase sigma-70 factor (ECF subfamily) n=1 Tax=Mangrovibacterium marinum TaxID=1639118 RepID=A0A2T5C637_9BACT|nr:RNA polymerase sigma-70 factor [Mangrovibacterium marinum]PTN10424.1 RNA polymerase sigma-70 factor (ECF subfamily) [Mangrovibacterium marinum]